MTDIDWLAVEHVCAGYRLKLRPAEKKAVVRRLSVRLQRAHEPRTDTTLTHEQVGARLGIDARTVLRYLEELPPATRKVCPVCRNDMFIAEGRVEPHPDACFNECPMSGRETLRGLAAVRPDLYAWLEAV